MDQENIKKIEYWYDENRVINTTFCTKINSLIQELIDNQRIPYQSITSRVKDKNSFLNKCKKDNMMTLLKK